MGTTPGNGRASPQFDSSGSAQQTLASWSEWIDNSCGADVFGCDENCSASRNMLGAALRLQTPTEDYEDLQEVDFAALHDELLESLIFEQTLKAQGGSDDDIVDVSSVPSSNNSEPILPTKRRRTMRFHRGNSSTSTSTAPSLQIAPLPEALSSESSTLSLGELAKTPLPQPSTYFHPQCRMQKDKGKGEEIGSNICAKGSEACLEKLRAKMQLLTAVVLDSSKGPATMKRKKARVAQLLANFTETRSLIELKMGFLSMTYGVLLRWDTGKTGKVTLVVLRKMCHESFYPAPSPLEPRWTPAVAVAPQAKTNIRDVVDSKNVIMDRQDGTEVTLLDPPYRVARPATMEPDALTATVVYATGMNRRSTWTIQVTYEDTSERVLLTWDEGKNVFVPKLGGPLKVPLTSLNLTQLQLRLYEHRLRRRAYRRLVSSMNIPLNNMEPQRSNSPKPICIVVPCKHDAGSTVAVSINLASDYGHWVNQELEMRHLEDASLNMWSTFPRITVVYDPPNDSSWDWICSVC